MKLIVTFSARADGNCGSIANYLAGAGDEVVHYHALRAHPCADCAYECFRGPCTYRGDGVYALYQRMTEAERVILLVPMYGGNPSSLYFSFCERGQDFFRNEEQYQTLLQRLYIIGVYGSRGESPDFLPILGKWFAGTEYQGRVLGLERHSYGQKMGDLLLECPEVHKRLNDFIHQKPGG